MIIVIANVQVKEGNGEKFVSAAQNCINETRKENGNISYNLLSNTEDKCNYTFVEEWESKESLDTHMKTEHFGSFGAAIQDLLAQPLDIAVYEGNKLA
ncbi:putative quinol monooxygenase [Konateibacter massiliensis]|uniref:putative quinol monooxygenase n=1 Tax=Konateibacter massiliensis TaxID=2002841 RepID=UPI000C149345|nr:putative quinol monooxygenase [Konateibacter massiliensis]